MSPELKNNILKLRDTLLQDIPKTYGFPVQIHLRELSSKRMDALVRVSIIPIHAPFQLQEFDIFQDRKGDVYWDRARDINENVNEKVIN